MLLSVLPATPLGAGAIGGIWTSPGSPVLVARPVVTPYSAAYLVDFRIDGAPSQPGDLIAFFDPQGMLCGLREVLASDDSSALLVTVYGDDPSTASVDEGAVDGDVLTVKLLQPSTQRIFQSAAVVLAPGTGQYESFPPSPVPPVWHNQEGHSLKVDTTTHFPLPATGPVYAEYAGHLTIRGAPADIGDEVAVYDPQGVLCGLFRVDTPGHYGFLRIYGDDTGTTSVDEGAAEGDLLTFRVWDRSAGIEYGADDIQFTAGSGGSGFVPSDVPPRWHNAAQGYAVALDIAVAASAAVAGDLNHNAVVDLADAVISLRIVAGLPPALPSLPRAADIDSDGKIGLAEALFVLQRLAGLR
jgi:hypothetical protein